MNLKKKKDAGGLRRCSISHQQQGGGNEKHRHLNRQKKSDSCESAVGNLTTVHKSQAADRRLREKTKLRGEFAKFRKKKDTTEYIPEDRAVRWRTPGGNPMG